MKKLIFTLFASCFLLFQGMAQITLNQSDVALPSTKYLRFNDTLPLASIQPGPTGANQTWNFTAMHHLTTDTLIFTDSQWTPYGSSFTNSNLCMMTMGSSITYSYMNNSPDSLTIVGDAGIFMSSPSPVVIQLNPVEKLFGFPTTYQSSFQNTSGFLVIHYYGQTAYGILIDSVKVKDITTVTSNVDAWGSLTTPLNTFNTLRTLIKTIEQDSIWVKSTSLGPGWHDFTSVVGVHDTTKKYTWWAKNIGFAIAEITVKASNDSVLTADYLGALPTIGGINEFATNDNSAIYPNPANDKIFITSDQMIKNVSIYNAPGELVKSRT